jgi:hypothetical protein
LNLQQFEARLRQLPCIVGYVMGQGCRCEELHHAGDAEERDDMNQVPLCHEHHEGATGVHGLHRRTFHMRYKLSDLKMLAITRRLYMKEYGA